MLAIIPVNDPRRGKQRLASLLDADVRAELVGAMLRDVLDACAAASSLEGTLVVTPAPEIAPPGCLVMTDPGQGHAHAIAQALRRDDAQPGIVVLMADCPLVTADALDELVGAAAPLALAPAQDGGTNALAMRPGNLMQPAFGIPGSCAVTMATARELALPVKLVQDPVFAIDLDDTDDVARVLSRGEGTRTAALLARAEPAPPALVDQSA